MNFAADLQIHPPIRMRNSCRHNVAKLSALGVGIHVLLRDITRHSRVCAWLRQRRRVSTAPLSTVAAVADRERNRRYRIGQTGNCHESHIISLNAYLSDVFTFDSDGKRIISHPYINLYLWTFNYWIFLLKKLLGKILPIVQKNITYCLK